MREMLRIEIGRALLSKSMLISLLPGMCIAICHFIYIQLFSNTVSIFDYGVSVGKSQMSQPDYIWGEWLGGTLFTMFGYLFFLLLPLLAALPYGASYLNDRRTGFLMAVVVRSGSKAYCVAKWFATFLAGGLAAALPLLFSFLMFLSVMPAIGPFVENMASDITDVNSYSALYYTMPVGYVGVTIATVFIFGGIFASFSLLISFIVDYSFVVLLLPFIATVFITTALDFFDIAYISPQVFLYPANGEGSPLVIYFEAVALITVSLFLFARNGFSGSSR